MFTFATLRMRWHANPRLIRLFSCPWLPTLPPLELTEWPPTGKPACPASLSSLEPLSLCMPSLTPLAGNGAGQPSVSCDGNSDSSRDSSSDSSSSSSRSSSSSAARGSVPAIVVVGVLGPIHAGQPRPAAAAPATVPGCLVAAPAARPSRENLGSIVLYPLLLHAILLVHCM